MPRPRRSPIGHCLLCGDAFVAFGPEGGRPRLYCEDEHERIYKQWTLELQRLAWSLTDPATFRQLPHGGPVRETIRAIRRTRKVGRVNKQRQAAWQRVGEMEAELARLTEARKARA